MADKLLSRIVTIEDDKGNWRKIQWVSECGYYRKDVNKNSDACIEIQLHNKLRPMLQYPRQNPL